MKNLLLLVALLTTTWFNFAVADIPAKYVTVDKPHYTVGIKPSGPFAHKVGDAWQGLSVDLMNTLSEKIGFTYEFVPVNTITALLSLPEMQTTDMAIGAISLSEEREKVIDFSHPYFTTTQGILAKENGSVFWYIAKRIAAAFLILVIVLYCIGFIVARLDPDDDIDNAHKGAWFVLVTFTTTGYGDYVPRNWKSKVFAAVIMLASLFILSGFTSYVTATLTIDKLSSTSVTLADLASNKSKVVAVGGTTTSNLLNKLEIRHNTIASADRGMEMVSTGEATAFVYDKAILDYLVLKEDNTSLVVHPLNRGMERYGLVFQSNSELRESFNVAILSIINSSEWNQLTAQYFGN